MGLFFKEVDVIWILETKNPNAKICSMLLQSASESGGFSFASCISVEAELPSVRDPVIVESWIWQIFGVILENLLCSMILQGSA